MNLDILDRPYPLQDENIHFYEKYGYIKLKDVIPSDLIDFFNEVISAKFHALNQVKTSLEERDTYGKAFLQIFNLWKEDESTRRLVFSQRLAKLASDLMSVDGVRLYHDQALFKEAGGGITPWHADQHYWPLSSDKAITAWIPLQYTPLDMGPLEFSAGSQCILTGRELSISDESESVIKNTLRVNNFPHVIEAFDMGEVSFHSGWVFHRAGANTTQYTRKVMTVIYMDKDMTLKEPQNDGQHNDWYTWCPGTRVGDVIQSPLNPILYTK